MDELTPSWFVHVDWTGAETGRRAVAERFRLVAPIGRGGSAEVWQAHDPSTDTEVAIKVLVSELAREPFQQAQLRHEARAVSRLAHRNIVRVFDVGTLGPEVERATDRRLVAGSPFVAMELMRGGTLLPLVANARTWPEVRRCLAEILSALAHAHARDVVHLDLKPSNLLRRDEEIVLTDFGEAQIAREGNTEHSTTPAYAAPEQLVGNGRDVGPRSDLYALGCVAWELLTGATPFADATAHERAFAAVPDLVPRVAVPDEVHDWLRGLLRSSPLQRTRSAAEALRTLPPEEGRGAADVGVAALPDWRSLDGATVESANLDFGLGLFGLGRVPFVGREKERDHLWSLARTLVASGEACRIDIVGAPGAGTSRLADWLLTRLCELDVATALRVETAEGLEDALVRHFVLEGLSPKHAVRRIELEVGAHYSISAGYAHGIADAAALIEHMARHKALVLHIDEDLPPTFHAPVLTLRTRHEGCAVTHGAVRGHDTLVLGPLTPSARHRLLHLVLRLGPGPRSALQQMALPGEILAMVGSWVESGELRREGGELRFAAATQGNPAMPWRARLAGLESRIGEGEMRALELAALLGQGAEIEVWGQAALAASTTPTLAALDRLTTEGLGRVEHRKIYLLNGAVRDAFIDRAGFRARSYHQACADAIRELAPERRRRERIARHLYGAGDWTAALSALEQGAQARLHARDPEGALALLALHRDAQVHARDALPGTAPEEVCIREMLLRTACLRRTAQPEARALAKETHRRARVLRQPGLLAKAAHQRGRLARTDADYDRAVRYLLEATHAAEEHSDVDLCSDIAVDLIAVFLSLGLLRRAEELWSATRKQESRPVGRAMLDVLGARVARFDGRPDVARERIARAIDALTDTRPRLLPEAWSEAAEIERADGKLERAVAFYTQALEGRVSLGTAAASLQLGFGLTLGELGRWEDASTHLRGAVGAWAAQGRQDMASGWTLALAWAAARTGDWAACAHFAAECTRRTTHEWEQLYERVLTLAEHQPDALFALRAIQVAPHSR